jgi:hypothetical protein
VSAQIPAYNRMVTHRVLRYLGLSIAGDLGPWTMYTNKNGKQIAYPRAPPEKPPTTSQIRQRNRLRVCMQNWKAETIATKALWNVMVAKLHLCAVGMNLYLSLSMRPDQDELDNANRRTGLALQMPAYVPP